jgi:hypothetical protein
MRDATANDDASILALQALGWTLGDQARAERFLALTGLDAETLRASAGSRATLTATIDFLAAHEPDLVACAEAIGIAPARLAGLRSELTR